MLKKKTDEPEAPKPIMLHTCALTLEQAAKLRSVVELAAEVWPAQR